MDYDKFNLSIGTFYILYFILHYYYLRNDYLLEGICELNINHSYLLHTYERWKKSFVIKFLVVLHGRSESRVTTATTVNEIRRRDNK